MENPNPQSEPDTNIAYHVNALHEMRDELVKTSLMLQDYRFHIDAVQRHAAAEHAKELIEKVKPLPR